MKLERFQDLYLSHLRARGSAESTLKGKGLALFRFFAHLQEGGIRDARKITEADVVAFVRALAEERSPRTRRLLAPNTRSHYVSVVRCFLAFLVRRGLLLYSPAAAVPLPERRRLPRALGQADVRRVLEAPLSSTAVGRRDRAVLELLYGTGLRLMECVRLDLMDVDLVQHLLLVRTGKGKKDRYVPLTGRAREAVLAYLRESRPLLTERWDDGALFVSRFGRRLGAMSVRVLVRKHGAKAGVKLTTHLLRHSCATHLLAGGADVRHVQKLLGHKDVTTTALYTKVDTASLDRMVRRCHPRER